MGIRRLTGTIPLLISVTLICTGALPLCAGTGTIVEGPPHYLNLNLYYDHTPTSMDVMRPAFEQASRLLFNSTNGQLYINSVRVSRNPIFQSKADFLVHSGTGLANSGGFGVLGNPGIHVTLWEDTHRWTNENGGDGNERGQFGIVHELGHHLFNLYNEYGSLGYYPGASCVSPTATVACIMDGGTQVHPAHHRTEWCTPNAGGLTTAHSTSPLNHQQAQHGVSCWDTLSGFCTTNYGLTITAPTAVNTADPTGLHPLSWIVLGDRVRLSLALDRSWSMSVDGKEPLAKAAAGLFTDLCREDENEWLGVVSFSNTAADEFAIQAVTGTPDTKSAAVGAINGIALQNMTAMGDGLRAALDQITGGGTVPADQQVTEAIVLLSDGVHNYGSETPQAVLPDLRSRGVRVFTVGVGDPNHPQFPLDEPTLLDLSSRTGALYTHATNAADLPTIYARYAAEVRGDGASLEAAGELVPGGSAERSVLVDRYTKEQTFVLHWPKGAYAFEVALRRPDGTILGPGPGPAWQFVSRPQYLFYRVPRPASGRWTMLIRAKQDLAGPRQTKLRFTAQALAKAPGVVCAVVTQRAFYQPADRVLIQAAATAQGLPVTRARVVLRLHQPDGKVATLAMYDDGRPEHGDARANDGYYATLYSDTKRLGTYRMELLFDAQRAVTGVPDEPSEGWVSKPVEPFIRLASGTFSVGRSRVRPPATERRVCLPAATRSAGVTPLGISPSTD